MATFRDLTQSKTLKVGTYIAEFVTPGLGRLLKSAGCEFAFVDMEHSGLTFETARGLLRQLHDADIATILRPPSKSPHDLSRACDIGAQGIIPAMLGSAEEAERCIRAIKYFPEGERGSAFGIAHDDYISQPVTDAMAAANRKTSFLGLIETTEGVENAGAIAALDKVHCLWLGHLDLTVSLGIPGDFGNAAFKDAVAEVMAAAKAAGKSVGRLVGSVEEGKSLFDEGCDFICYLGDVWLLRKALADGIDGIRAAVGEGTMAGRG